jgi:hypothetical protein
VLPQEPRRGCEGSLQVDLGGQLRMEYQAEAQSPIGTQRNPAPLARPENGSCWTLPRQTEPSGAGLGRCDTNVSQRHDALCAHVKPWAKPLCAAQAL